MSSTHLSTEMYFHYLIKLQVYFLGLSILLGDKHFGLKGLQTLEHLVNQNENYSK